MLLGLHLWYVFVKCDISITLKPIVAQHGTKMTLHCSSIEDPWIFTIKFQKFIDGVPVGDTIKIVEYLYPDVGALHTSFRDRASFDTSSNTLVINKVQRLKDEGEYRCEVIDSDISLHRSDDKRLKIIGKHC